MENSSDSFAELLKAFRKRRRMTQAELAERLDVHLKTIGGWERDKFRPHNKEQVLELARALRLTDQETRQLLEASFTAPAPHWVVPYPRNPLFTGREDTLAQLHALLTAKQRVAVTSWALSGLGGIGKTQLALEYAYCHALDYSAVFWINAETRENIASSYGAIAESLALPERKVADQQQLHAAVHRWFNAHSGWLVIWDNVEDLTLVSRYLTTLQGTHLMTTRQATAGTLAQSLELLPLPPEEALLFLLRRAKRLAHDAVPKHLTALAQREPAEHKAAKTLVRLLDGLPLALDQAGAYIEEASCSITTYLKRYRARRGQLLARRGASAGHPESVLTTLALACQRLAGEPIATDLLHLCAFLAPDAIPEDLLTLGGKNLGEILASAATNQVALDEAFVALRTLSFVQRQPETQTISLHRLVQAVVQEQLSKDEQRQWAERAVRLVAAAFPDSNEYSTWDRCRQLLPHALTCASHVKQWGFTFPEAAHLLNEAGHYLRQRARLQEAIPLLEQALSIREQTLAANDPDLALSLNNVASGYIFMGLYQKALPLFQQSMAIREQIFGPNHPEVARSLNNLGFIYRTLGQAEEAQRVFLRAIAILKQAPEFGPDHPHVATILRNLADLYRSQAQYQAAELHYKQALAIREQALESDHPDLAHSLYALAAMYDIERRYEEALVLHDRALKIREKALGPHHPDVANSLAGLGQLYHHLGRYEEAITLLRRAHRIFEQSQGLEHPETAYCWKQLADVYTKQGEYEQAEALYQQVLLIFEDQLGSDHLSTAETLKGLASLREEQRQYDDARAFYQRALTIQERRLGKTNPETVQTRAQYRQLVLQRQAAEVRNVARYKGGHE